MQTIIEKLKKSELFPENIRDFLIKSFESGIMDRNIINELEDMLKEEEEAIAKIDNKPS